MLRVRKELAFDDRWLLFLGIPLVALVLSMVMFPNMLLEKTGIFFSMCYPISIFYTGAFWFCFRLIIIWIRRREAFIANTRNRIFAEFGIVFLAYLFLKPILEFLVELLPDQHGFVKPHPSLEIFSSIILSFFILLIYEIIFVQKQLEKSNLEKAQLSRAHMQAQLEGLRNQIQPHFLFNSLNTLSALIGENTAKAENYVQQLSKVFRYVLDIKDESLIPLEEEISFLQAYIYLLKERFGSNLAVELEVPSEYNGHLIAPLSLQILFENAIKHNAISAEKPLRIQVTVDTAGKLVVENNLQPRQEKINSTRMGLENIKKRYQFMMDDPIEISSTLESFRVQLPLLSSAGVQQ